MNVWMDIAIPALVFAAGCLAVAIWALKEMEDYKARWKQLQQEGSKTGDETTALANRVVSLLAENGALQLKLDEALRPKSPPSDGAAKKPRVSRAKPPMTE